ncbi:class F sortase [Streptomyces sp. NPDC001404]|uniref:class F sortase n=1 Tax=Streptomyces sp. NPDC001404 TaxID=3364571 RepID=UPI0036813BA4
MSRTRLSPLALLLVLPALLVGCSLDGGTDKAIGGPARAEEPSRVSIPSIGVDSPLMRLGLNKDDTVQVPPPEKGMTAGWYTGSVVPGDAGAAVIIGHNATRNGEAVFHDLKKVGKGMVIDVRRGDGQVLHFTVTGTETVRKNAFPTRKVYGGTSEKALRLVTCAGDLDADGHPVDNLIVYASLPS